MNVNADVLRPFVAGLFRAVNVPAGDAERAAAIHVLQEMRGVRTHGLRRVRQNVRGLIDGQINPTPLRKVLRDEGAVTVIDGDAGLGMLGSADAMQRAMAKATLGGVGIGMVIHSNHFLSAAPYCLQAAEGEMIGIAFSNTQQSMGYPGAATRAIGNGPFGFAAPTAAGFPVVFDAAMAASFGKLSQWARAGGTLPPELPAIDADGRPTNDPKAVIAGGTAMPIGMHKGAGLAVLIDVLTGVLGGGAFLSAILPTERRKSKEQGESQCCIAIDVAHFMPPSEFRGRMAAFIADLKSQPRAPGCDEILAPGEHAWACVQSCLKDGVPLEPEIERELRALAKQVGAEVPF